MHILTKLHSFKGDSKFSTWLYSVTQNYCINYLNRDKARKINLKSKQAEKENSLAFEINDNHSQVIREDKLEKALKTIPHEDRLILKMKYQDNVSIKELQKALNISESAVKMRISRAKFKITKIYRNLEIL